MSHLYNKEHNKKPFFNIKVIIGRRFQYKRREYVDEISLILVHIRHCVCWKTCNIFFKYYCFSNNIFFRLQEFPEDLGEIVAHIHNTCVQKTGTTEGSFLYY